MAVYKNISSTVKEFYGIKFAPGASHRVNGCINDSKMIRLADTAIEDDKAPLTEKVCKSKNKSSGGKVDG